MGGHFFKPPQLLWLAQSLVREHNRSLSLHAESWRLKEVMVSQGRPSTQPNPPGPPPPVLLASCTPPLT